MRRCKACLLPDVSAGANLDTGGICEYCRNRLPVDGLLTEEVRVRRERDFERALAVTRFYLAETPSIRCVGSACATAIYASRGLAERMTRHYCNGGA